jgi:putative membrane protein insertion efficiency factor
MLVALIRLYQRYLSPFLGGHCRFTPTCSDYAIGAIKKHGAIRGTGYAIWRILRCQPFCKGGHDPVP